MQPYITQCVVRAKNGVDEPRMAYVLHRKRLQKVDFGLIYYYAARHNARLRPLYRGAFSAL